MLRITYQFQQEFQAIREATIHFHIQNMEKNMRS